MHQNKPDRRLEGDYSTGPWKHTPPKLDNRWPAGWWVLPALGLSVFLMACLAAWVV